jgi:hypothetical protein
VEQAYPWPEDAYCFDPIADHPRRIVITPSTVNDVVAGRGEPLEASAIPPSRGQAYIFDKAYCDYGWWARIHEAEAVSVTRLKKNAKFEVFLERSPEETPSGDGFTSERLSLTINVRSESWPTERCSSARGRHGSLVRFAASASAGTMATCWRPSPTISAAPL